MAEISPLAGNLETIVREAEKIVNEAFEETR